MPVPNTAPDARGGTLAGAESEPSAFLKRPEVRDVLAWMRLLVDPQDAAAVVRALARPPIELRQAHLARVIQLARRRKMDLVAGLTLAVESPQVPPEARERIARFATLHRSARSGIESLAPEAFVAELIELLGTPGRPLLAPQEAREQRASLQGLLELAREYARLAPETSARELACRLLSSAPVVQEGTAGADQFEVLAGSTGSTDSGSAASPGGEAEQLEALLQQLREEVLDSVARIGGRLGELRLDTELDVAHGMVRYLELLKLAALLQRPDEEQLADTLADVNARLLAAASPLQREIFQSSPLDETLLGDSPRAALGHREEHSLGPFLPRKGVGLALSASDIDTYRSCPLRYKFARVLRIPLEQTVHQRFGIVVHQVLERFHGRGGQTLAQMLELLDSGWRRAGLGDGEYEQALFEKARIALTRYHARLLGEQSSEPVWFERSFAFRLGPHHLRGRVDRVDRLYEEGEGREAEGEGRSVVEGQGPGVVEGVEGPGAGVDEEALARARARAREQAVDEDAAGARYELIDYKTSRPKTPEQLQDDVQLSLYALAAREAWELDSSQQAYYYVLDDVKVPVPRGQRDADALTELVLEVGEGILAQEFAPTPSPTVCSMCDYRIVCPAAEA